MDPYNTAGIDYTVINMIGSKVTMDDEFQYVFVTGYAPEISIVDHTVQGMNTLRFYALGDGGPDYLADLLPIEQSDRFFWTSNRKDMCIYSMSEGEMHLCLELKPGVTFNNGIYL